jgi:hypothetical protein
LTAGLVADRAVGTRRIYRVDPDGLAELRSYFEHFDASRDRAFEIFTVGIGTWWSPDHHILRGELAEATVGSRCATPSGHPAAGRTGSPCSRPEWLRSRRDLRVRPGRRRSRWP